MPTETGFDREKWESLVTAIISVNNFGLSKADALREPLAQSGLFDESVFTNPDIGRGIVNQLLINAGYDDDTYVLLAGLRIHKAIRSIRYQGIGAFFAQLQADKETASATLDVLYGVGPKVKENYFLLVELDD